MVEIQENPKVYIIVLNWNGEDDTLECLESIKKLDYPNYRVILVDNGSSADSIKKIKDWINRQQEQPVLIETGKNLGFAGGNNVGLRYALSNKDFTYAWILNNDITVTPATLASLVQRMKADPCAGICGSMLLAYEDHSRIYGLAGFYDRWFAQSYGKKGSNLFNPSKLSEYKKLEKSMDYVPGAAMLVSRQFLEEIGLMCEDYFLFFEEIDWATRARGRYTLALAPDSIVYHKGSATLKRAEGRKERFSLLQDRYISRNRLLFTAKFYPYALPIVYLSLIGYVFDRLLAGAWQNAWVVFKSAFSFNPLTSPKKDNSD